MNAVYRYGLREVSKAKRKHDIIQAYLKNPNGSIDEISRIAFISRGTLFNYFDNFQQLKYCALAYFALDTKYKTNYNHIGMRYDKLKEYDLFTTWSKAYQDNISLPTPSICELEIYFGVVENSISKIEDILNKYASKEAFLYALDKYLLER